MILIINVNFTFLKALKKIEELAVSIEGKSLEEKKQLLCKCAATTLSSKLIGGEKEFFASMVVDAVLAIGNDDRLNLIGIKKVYHIVSD
jgi:T-complex protein 1 subunit eta